MRPFVVAGRGKVAGALRGRGDPDEPLLEGDRPLGSGAAVQDLAAQLLLAVMLLGVLGVVAFGRVVQLGHAASGPQDATETLRVVEKVGEALVFGAAWDSAEIALGVAVGDLHRRGLVYVFAGSCEHESSSGRRKAPVCSAFRVLKGRAATPWFEPSVSSAARGAFGG